jgi:hypothetical protein
MSAFLFCNKKDFQMFVKGFFLALVLLLIPTFSYAKDYSYYSEQCEPLRSEVVHILQSYDISTDYYYLMVAESHCQIKTSKAGAKGYWQMMPRTARKYGCDNPENLTCATHAAAKYLKHLEEKCGKDNVVFCWHDGGTNFLKKQNKKPSQGAKGLNWQFHHLIKTDLLDGHELEHES